MVISNKPLRFIIAILVACLPLVGFANAETETTPAQTETTAVVAENATKTVDEKSNIVEKIAEKKAHHVLDAHEFSLFEDEATNTYYGFPLPIILWDNGVQLFSSSKFNHGEAVAESNGNFYKLGHNEKIYKTDASGTMTGDEHHPSNPQVLDFSITKSVFTMMIVALLMFLLFSGLAKSYSKNGGISAGAGRLFEPIVLYVRDEIAIPNIGEKHYKRYMSFLLTIFFFIWFLNIFGLTPLGINVTGNIAITAGLGIITFIITTFTANKNYWGHIFWMPGVPTPMKIILAPIELLGIFIKPFALMIRLYANMIAGHIVVMSLLALIFIFKNIGMGAFSLILTFIISIIEILVAALQAYIFTMLAALYFGSAVEEHHHEEAH
ncbi:F0F1 ATP synthase subunit A [Flavobacterium sp.]|uniref:F0F1 ATP synthase subunit A n=1 Tax=Flavobacterium sp. TaxID=239 RepID=UPI0037A7BBFB